MINLLETLKQFSHIQDHIRLYVFGPKVRPQLVENQPMNQGPSSSQTWLQNPVLIDYLSVLKPPFIIRRGLQDMVPSVAYVFGSSHRWGFPIATFDDQKIKVFTGWWF